MNRHSIIGLAEILKWMTTQGYNRQELLYKTGLDDARLREPKSTLSAKEELRFCQNLLHVSKDPYILLKAGFNLKISAYGMWGLALLSSPTFGKSIELGLQYVDFSYTFNKISYVHDTTHASLRITQLADLGTLQKPMVERDLSAIFVLFQALLQQDKPFTEICLAWSFNAADPYEILFSCPVRYDCDITEVKFPVSLLTHELPQYNALTIQLCKEQLDLIRPALVESGSVIDGINGYFLRTPLIRINSDDCAKALGLSSRQLRRRVTEEGSSFQMLFDRFRRALAEKYLDKTPLSLEGIAERLGYSDAANFSHAFKRWTGMSPRKFSQISGK